MTMFSPENRRLQFYGGGGGGGYGGGEGFGGGYGSNDEGYYCVGSDLVFGAAVMMAEEDSRTQSLNESSSKDGDRDAIDDGWLQLSIGGGGSGDRKTANLVELDLMPSNNRNNNNRNSNNNNDDQGGNFISHSQIRPLPAANFGGGFSPAAAFLLQNHPQGGSSSNFPPNQEINWGFRPAAMIPISLASSSPLMASASYCSRPFQLDAPAPAALADFRVIPAPRRPHSGLWFMLHASQNQEKEPFLPQISNSYLRIKDGKMTVRLVIKYLMNKLRLENESEIEIRCKGQKLEGRLTLEDVRDSIWCSAPRDMITLHLPHSSAAPHVMVLHYSRTAPNSHI